MKAKVPTVQESHNVAFMLVKFYNESIKLHQESRNTTGYVCKTVFLNRNHTDKKLLRA
jgi:hypothetical protein